VVAALFKSTPILRSSILFLAILSSGVSAWRVAVGRLKYSSVLVESSSLYGVRSDGLEREASGLLGVNVVLSELKDRMCLRCRCPPGEGSSSLEFMVIQIDSSSPLPVRCQPPTPSKSRVGSPAPTKELEFPPLNAALSNALACVSCKLCSVLEVFPRLARARPWIIAIEDAEGEIRRGVRAVGGGDGILDVQLYNKAIASSM